MVNSVLYILSLSSITSSGLILSNSSSSNSAAGPGITDATIIAAIIAAAVSILVSALTFYITVRKNKQEGIIEHRVEWLENIREEISKILSWEPVINSEDNIPKVNSMASLQKSIYKVGLYMGINTQIDIDIIKLCNICLHHAENVQKYILALPKIEKIKHDRFRTYKYQPDWQEVLNLRKKIVKEARIYFKVEWIRINSEYRLHKGKYWKRDKRCQIWKPRKFDSSQAVADVRKQYRDE